MLDLAGLSRLDNDAAPRPRTFPHQVVVHGRAEQQRRDGGAVRVGVPVGEHDAPLAAGDVPVDLGYLAHHVAAVPGGSVMRSRFWLGKPYLAARTTPVRAVLPIAKRLIGLTELDARALLVHCSQEMTHLAAFLPALHEQEA